MLTPTVQASFLLHFTKSGCTLHLVWTTNILFRDQNFCQLVLVVPGHMQ